MVPLESPVREIRTLGLVSRGWERAYESQIERQRESERITLRTLRAPRYLLTLPELQSGVISYSSPAARALPLI